MQTANFTTGGMRREGCAHTIRNTLERLDGVKPNSVSRESRTARVLLSPRTVPPRNKSVRIRTP